MKKLISLTLTALMLASALVACAPKEDQLDPAITLASSDARANAEWLQDRLGSMPQDVVIGVGSNAAHGIDMSDFEDDGYILREMNGEVMIFGATAKGLDLAVRKYAKAVQADTTANLDETYHEGYRVESLSIAGNGIDEYAVVCDAALKPSVGQEVVRLIAEACGADLAIGSYETKPAAEHYIYVDLVDDASLKETGCRYYIKDGDVYIEGAYELGVANGIYLFLQEQCGWEDLIFGNSELREAESVDIPADASAEYPMMTDYFCVYDYATSTPGVGNTPVFYEPFDNERSKEFIYYGRVKESCHGIFQWTHAAGAYGQICHTDQDIFYEVVDNIVLYLDSQQAAGKKIGYDLNFIDLSQSDWFGYCLCQECAKVFREEGGVHSGAVVRFANSVSEEVIKEGYDGLKYGIFAYHGSNIPCKTAPNDDVYVTFCTDGHCSVHPISTGECTGVSHDMAGYLAQKEFNNFDYAEWIEGWTELSDNIYIWYYTLDNNMHQYTVIDQLYKDFRYFYERGVKGVFWQMQHCGPGTAHVQHQLGAAINRNPEMTEAEYYELVDVVLEKTYGDGWEYVKEYLDILEQAELLAGCQNCWNYTGTNFEGQVDHDFYRENWEYMLELIEKARYEANSAKQEKYCELLSLSPLYMGCALNYFGAYDADDQETLMLLAERYDLMIARMKEHGLNPAGFNGVDYSKIVIAENLHEQAWTKWVEARSEYAPAGSVERPMPEEY